MVANTDAAFSRGDVMREIRKLNERIDALETRRDLPHASYGTGGPRTRGGRFLAEDLSGQKVFEVTTEPPDIFMRPELISTVARQVIGESIYSADADDQIDLTDTSFSFVSAPDGNGPSLTDVPISASGRAIVLISANILAAPTGDGSSEVSALIGYEVSGASSVAASSENAGQLSQVTGIDDTSDISITVSATRMSLLTGLNEGLHNFEAKYQVTEFQTGDEGSFIFRNITVIAF